MSEEEKDSISPESPAQNSVAAQSGNEKFRELAELEEEIRRRLRSNQRFLDKFLDEDFVDDEADEDVGSAEDDEEL